MPSGSGGGGGSHFGGGGGSHFGGSGGSGRSSGGSRSSRPIYFGFGGISYYVPLKQSSLIRLFFIMALFFFVSVIPNVGSLRSTNSELKKIVSDRNRYIAMINNAEKNGDYIRQGKIIGRSYNSDCGKYYFSYIIETDDGDFLIGSSYSLYDDDEIALYTDGRILDFAVDSVPVTMRTDSIDLDYKYKSLSDDGEYAVRIRSRSRTLSLAITLCIAALGCAAVAAILFFKNVRRKEADDAPPDDMPPDGNDGTAINRCEYCGGVLKNGEVKCPNCGATKK